MKKSFSTKGFSLVEMLIYISILSIISILIFNIITTFSKTYRDVLALRLIDHSAVDVMERLTRDIRGGTQVDLINSTLGSNPGVLTIITTSGSVSTTTKFYLE